MPTNFPHSNTMWNEAQGRAKTLSGGSVVAAWLSSARVLAATHSISVAQRSHVSICRRQLAMFAVSRSSSASVLSTAASNVFIGFLLRNQAMLAKIVCIAMGVFEAEFVHKRLGPKHLSIIPVK